MAAYQRIVYDRHCAVQDMMTLNYRLARENLDGTTPAGPQSLGIAISHLPATTPYPVPRARLRVSFDGGMSWQPAVLARICHRQVCTNRYTHGATVTETILDAYQTA